jgi:TRAP-type C4-dicarboxylate transport system substrate-binding protein
MKRNLCISLVIIAFILSTLAVVCGPVSAQDQVIKLKYSNFFPPAHKISKLTEDYIKEIEKRTNGKVKIMYFPGNTLTPPAQAYDSTVQGITDISQCIFIYSKGRFPLTDVLNYPIGIKTGLQATRLANAYYKKFQPKEMTDTHILYMHGHGPALVMTRKVIKSLDEIKGVRIKASGTSGDVIKAYGGIPVTMPIPETYEALQKGLADGIILPIETLKNWKFADFLKCLVYNYGVGLSNAMFVTMNQKKWDSLPKDVQKVFEEVSAEWIDKQGKLWDEIEKDGLEYAKQKPGFTIVNATPQEEAKAREKMKPIIAEYVKEMKQKGLPGEEAVKFCQDWLGKNP